MAILRLNDEKPGSGSESAPLHLKWKGGSYAIQSIDEFTFVVAAPALARADTDAPTTARYTGEVCARTGAVKVQFRVRRIEGSCVVCSFFDLPLKTRDRLNALVSAALDASSNALHSLSYDELALGRTEAQHVAEAPAIEPSSTLKKAVAASALVAAMLLIAGWLTMVVHTKSKIPVANSVMAGNFQPVNTPLEGKLLDVRVAVGDRVHAGTVLATVENSPGAFEFGAVEAKLDRAKRDLAAFKNQKTEIEEMLEIARQSLKTRRIAAISKRARIVAELTAAESQLERLTKLLSNQTVKAWEHEQAVAARERWVAELDSQNAIIDGIELAEKATAEGVIIDETKLTNPMAEIRTKIALAESLVAELSARYEGLAAKAKPAELVAPASGTVYAIYRRPGEVLRLAEEAIAINRDGEGWATGHISAQLAAQIKPGQPVEIEIPSYGKTTTGVVQAIGHRAVHGRGSYTAEFRGGPLDVPIRVALDQTEMAIPSGLRLNMTVRVRDPLKDIRSWFSGWAGPVAADDGTSPRKGLVTGSIAPTAARDVQPAEPGEAASRPRM